MYVRVGLADTALENSRFIGKTRPYECHANLSGLGKGLGNDGGFVHACEGVDAGDRIGDRNQIP